MSECNGIKYHPTVVSACNNWIQFFYWLSSTRAVLQLKPGFTHFKRFESLAKALRRAGLHYFEYEGYIIWELGPRPGEKSGVHVHQYLISWRYPDFPLSSKQQLTADELHHLRALGPALLVGKHTFSNDVVPATSKNAQSKFNRRRKANLGAQAELDILATPVNYVTCTSVTPYDSSHQGSEYVCGSYHQQPPTSEVQQMYSATYVLFPQSPESENYGSPLATYSASESDGLDDFSFQSGRFYNLDSDQIEF